MAQQTVTFQLNKLVRDKMPFLMRELGENPEVIYLEGERLYREHVQKIVEEYDELRHVGPESPSYIKELADLTEAVDSLDQKFERPSDEETLELLEEVRALINSFGDQKALAECRAERKSTRGGFSDGAYVGKLILRANDRWVDYYRNEPERYPEL